MSMIPDPNLRPWLVRIPEIFEGIAEDILKRFGAASVTRLGLDFYSIKTATPIGWHCVSSRRGWRKTDSRRWTYEPEQSEKPRHHQARQGTA